MRLNTTKSMKLARRVKERYGSWQAVREASRRENGIYIVRSDEQSADQRTEAVAQGQTA